MKDDQWINMPRLSLTGTPTPTPLTASSIALDISCNNTICDRNDRSVLLRAGNDGDLI